MPKIIDEELEKVRKAGGEPTLIEVGFSLLREIEGEQNPQVMAPITSGGQPAPVRSTKKVTEYQGIPVRENQITDDGDFLKVHTKG